MPPKRSTSCDRVRTARSSPSPALWPSTGRSIWMRNMASKLAALRRPRALAAVRAAAGGGGAGGFFVFLVGVRHVGRTLVDSALRERGQLFVRRLLLAEVLLEQFGRVVMSHRARPCDQRAVRRHFIVLGALAGR